MIRVIRGLHWVERCEAPWQSPKNRRGAKAKGLAYERRVGRALAKTFPKLEHNPWFAFEDSQGRGHCSPDFLLELDGRPLVLEVKLGDVSAGLAKLRYLYGPILRMWLGREIEGVVVVKFGLGEQTLRQALGKELGVVQWGGVGPFPVG